MADKHPRIVPMLAYEQGTVAMEWLCKTFGFSEKLRMLDDDGILIHGEIELGETINAQNTIARFVQTLLNIILHHT